MPALHGVAEPLPVLGQTIPHGRSASFMQGFHSFQTVAAHLGLACLQATFYCA